MKQPTKFKTLRRASGIRLLGVAMLLAGTMTSCSRNDLPADNTDASGALHFEVRINSDWCSSMSIGNSKAAVDGTAFSGSTSGVTYQIGMSILRTADATAYVTGSDHILAELTVKTGSPDVWRYQLKGSSTWLAELPHPVKNEALTVAAYYPYSASTVVTTTNVNVPFDLTATTEQADQTDLLYAPKADITPGSATPLAFRHFYSLLEFRMKKKQTEAAILTGVSVLNASGKTWVAGKGSYNVSTGQISDTPTAGTVSHTGLNLTLTTTTYQTVQVMVPSRTSMTAYADGDIQVQFDFGSSHTALFSIKRAWLFAGTSTGLTAGMKYSFQLLYDAGAYPSLTLKPWRTGGGDSMVGYLSPYTIEYGVAPFNVTSDATHTIPSSTSTSYNNAPIGQAYITSLQEAFLNEPPYKKFEVAAESEIGRSGQEGEFSWQDAMYACEYKTTNGRGWRVPRVTELILIDMNRNALAAIPGFTDFDGWWYWAATENDSNIAWYYDFRYNTADYYDKSLTTNAVRCVREVVP